MSTTRVRLPDGSYVTVPTTDRAKAAEAAKRYWSSKQAETPRRPRPDFGRPATASSASSAPKAQPKALPKPKPKKKAAPKKDEGFFEGALDTAGKFVDNVADNVFPNWGDEIAGFGGGLGALLQGAEFDQGYDQQSAAFKRRQEEYKEENPKLHMASAATGMGLGLALPAGRALDGASLAARSAQAAGVGAAYGGLAGAGDGESLDQRGGNAVEGALVGGTFGAMIPGATQVGSKGIEWARRNLPGVDATIRTASELPARAVAAARGRTFEPTVRAAGAQAADRMIGERMRNGSIDAGFGQQGPQASPQAIAQEVAKRNSAGVPAMIGDVTDEMRGLTEYASRGVGPGQRLVREAIEGRKAQEGVRVRQAVQDTLPTTDDPIRYVEEATRRAREEAGPLYQQAYGQPVFRTKEIQAIEQTPAFRDALPQAYRNIRNQIDEATGAPKSPQAMGFREMRDVDPNGLPPNGPHFQAEDGTFISFEDGLSVEGYDQVLRAMRDQGRAAGNINPVTGRLENTTNSVHINGLTRDLQQRLGSQNPSFREATTRYADEMGMNNAFRQGEQIANMTGPEAAAILRANPQDNAREAFTRGAGTALANEATRYASKYPTGDTANRIRQSLGDAPKREALATAQGGSGPLDNLAQRLEFEGQANKTYRSVNGNSATAQRQQLDRDLDGDLGIPTSVPDAIRRVVASLTERAAPQLQQEVKQRIAQVVTASDAKTVQEAMEAIAAQAERDAKFRKLLQQANIGAAGVYGSQIETN